MKKFTFLYTVLFATAFLFCAWGAKSDLITNPPHKVISLSVCGKIYRTWVADNDKLRENGLMHFPELKPDQAMIFIFNEEIPRTFWMKNVPYDLDIAFFNKRKKLVSQTTMKGTSPMMQDEAQPTYSSFGSAMFAIETHAGSFAKLAKKCELKILK